MSGSNPRDTELIQYATEIKVRAERRCGELLAAPEKNTGTRVSGGMVVERCDRQETPTLADMGLTKSDSSRYQQLAAMPAEHFETAVATAKATAGADEMAAMRDALDRARALTSELLRYGEQRNLELYARTGHRKFVWQVFADYRRAGLPAPESVQAIFDDWATEARERESHIARAAERRLDIVRVHASHIAAGMTPGEADAAVAATFATSTSNVRRIRSQWNSHDRSPDVAGADGAAVVTLESAYGMSLVTVKRHLP